MEEVLDKMENEAGFFHHNQYHIEAISESNVVLKANITPNSMNPYGCCHGGFIFGLGDTIMGMLASSDGRGAYTLNANISYLKPGKGEYLLARGEIVRRGRTTCVVRANIYDDKEELVAIMDSTYYYINERK